MESGKPFEEDKTLQNYSFVVLSSKSPHLIDGSEGDVMIQELAVLHEHECVSAVEVRHVGVDHDGHQPGTGEGLAVQRAEAGARDG